MEDKWAGWRVHRNEWVRWKWNGKMSKTTILRKESVLSLVVGCWLLLLVVVGCMLVVVVVNVIIYL